MRYRGLSWKLILGNALLLAGGLLVGSWAYSEYLTQRASAAALARFAVDAGAWADMLAHSLDSPQLAHHLEALTAEGGRAAILTADGRLVAARGAGTLEAIREQPELRRALDGTAAAARRTLGSADYDVAAAPIPTPAGQPRAALWVARPAWTWRDSTAAVLQLGLFIVAVALFFSLLLAALAARFWRRPLRRIAEHAARMSPTPNALPAEIRADDLTGLAQSLDDLRSQWDTQFESVQRQRVTLEALLAQIHEGVVATQADGRLVLINPAAVRLLQLADDGPITGDTCKKMIGQAIERCIPHHDVLELLRMRRGGSRVDDAGGDRHTDEARLQVDTPDGVIHVLARGADLLLPSAPDAQGSAAAGRVVVLTDISEIIRTGQVRADFVANASHELRTPLSTIRASVEALTSIDLLTEHDAAARFIGVIDRQSARLAAMVSDLLDLARLESSATTYASKELHWDEVATDLEERFADRIGAKALQFSVERPADAEDGVLVLSPYLLGLVIDNLVDNAIKFTPPRGIVRVLFRRDVEHVIIEVEDSGCGIPTEDQERVFERFYQVERARSGPDRGTGLGLSIVRRAALALGGTATLTSVLGKGTRFTITLPQEVQVHK